MLLQLLLDRQYIMAYIDKNYQEISIVMLKLTFHRINEFILVLLITIYCLNNQAMSQAVVKECDTPTWAASMGDEGCITECGDLDVTAEVNGFKSLCSGRATSFKIKFYKIVLGNNQAARSAGYGLAK